jgi:hypothetical protein
MSIERKCSNCNAPLSKYERRYCSHRCQFEYIRGKTWEEIYGVEGAKKIHEKHEGKHRPGKKFLRETRICQICNSPFICIVTATTKFCSMKCYNKFQRGRSFHKRYGTERAKIVKEKMIFTLKKNHLNAVGKHYEEILRQAKILEKDGFRCIPIGKVVPDIVAIKNNQIFAIEVEKGKPKWEKYTDDIRKFYDDIIWIILKEQERKMVKG